MANRQVKDALAVMAVSVGVATLAVLITAVLTGSHLWIGVFMVIPTLVITFRYFQERRRFRRG
jgi:hypothetical protein